MKLWQKIFLCTLILVMLAVGVTSILLLENSYSLAMNQKKQSVYSEHEFLITGFKSMVVTERLKQNAVVLEAEKVEKLMKNSIAESMEENASGSMVFLDEEGWQICADRSEKIPKELLALAKKEKSACMQTRGEKLYTASNEIIEGVTYYFVTVQDISEVIKVHEDMLQRIQIISMGCALGIAVVLLVVVKLLLLPLQKINAGTGAIARGEYHKRIPETGRDELSELAGNMNCMAAAVEENIKALEDVAENRKQFIDNLAHEMKTPLTSILGFSDLLLIQKNISEESRREYAGIIKEEAARMRTLSGKLMELITVGEANVEWKKEEMQQLFAEVENTLQVVAAKQKLELNCTSEEGWIMVDKELFKSLIYNLVDNAIKATGEGGHIQVRGYFEKEEFVVRVEDDGVGIPAEELSKITQAFYMVDKARSRKKGGAGLGLALCTEIVRIHQGIMQFESELNQGTCVIIRMKGGQTNA